MLYRSSQINLTATLTMAASVAVAKRESLVRTEVDV